MPPRRIYIVWHYTTEQHFRAIAADGAIKPATAGVPRGEKAIVWFSTETFWEPTANKGGFGADGPVDLSTVNGG